MASLASSLVPGIVRKFVLTVFPMNSTPPVVKEIFENNMVELSGTGDRQFLITVPPINAGLPTIIELH